MPVTKWQPVFEVGDWVIVGTGIPSRYSHDGIYVLRDHLPASIPQADGYSVDEDPGDCNDAQIP